jgi:hypothetical protein
MAGWNGLSIAVAQRLLSKVEVEVVRNDEEGCIIATHPRTKELLRRGTVTGCVEAVLQEWVTLK